MEKYSEYQHIFWKVTNQKPGSNKKYEPSH